MLFDSELDGVCDILIHVRTNGGGRKLLPDYCKLSDQVRYLEYQ